MTLTEWLASALERHPWRFVLLFCLAFATASALKAARLPLWTDEILTLMVVRQTGVTGVLAAIREGCDSAPPLYALAARALTPVLGEGALALRLPSLVGFIAMCLAVFVFARRRMPAAWAALAMLIACDAAYEYATEARPYGMVLGCAGWALVCWQAAAEDSRRRWALTGLGLSLALGIAFHYYTVAVVAVLATGEAVRWRASRRTDVPVLLALGLPALVLIPHYPLILAAARFAPTFWARPSLASVPGFYHAYLGGVAVLLFASIAVWAVRRPPALEKRVPSFPACERAACAALALMPVPLVAAGLIAGVGIVPRYAISALIGVAVLLTLFWAGRTSTSMAAGLVIAFLALGALRAADSLAAPFALREAEAIRQVLPRLPEDPAPILIANDHAFLELWFYGGPRLRQRLFYGLSPAMDRQYNGTDTSALILSALRRRVPIQAPDYGSFVASHPRFFLVADGRDWRVWRLLKSGFRIAPVLRWSDVAIYGVARSDSRTGAGST